MLTLPPLSLYIHIPWCIRKCPYCDFNSHQGERDLPEQAYVAALAQDLGADAKLAQGRPIKSIFFGGGTPSLFSAEAINSILAHAEKTLGFAADIEITLEANPGTFEQAKFADYRSAGVNRLSIGIQSFNDAELHALGRIHDGQAARRAVDTARRAGFDNINLDLMHGLPGQDTAAAMTDLATAISFSPEHISWYQLTIEPNTVFYSAPPPLPVDDVLADIQEEGHLRLADAGYRQYEVSAYARGPEARHNLNYWTFGDYLGIGAGAHGKITDIANGEIFRLWKTRQPGNYLNAGGTVARFTNPYTAGRNSLSATELPLEFMLNALRLSQGVTPALFEARTGLPTAILADTWSPLRQRGLVLPLDEKLATTPLGFRFLNDVLQAFNTL